MPKTLMIKLPGKPLTTLTADGFCAPCVAQELQEQTAAVQATYFNSDGSADVTETDAEWEGPLIFEGQFTGDGRFIDNSAISWDDSQFPMPLRYAPEDIGAHGGAQVVGLINSLERRPDGGIWGRGIIDTSTELGAQTYHGLQKGTIKGVSADLDAVELEVRVKKEIYDAFQNLMDAIMNDEEIPEETPEVTDGYVKVAEYASDDEVMFITGSRFRAATLVDIPAFVGAYVALTEGGEPLVETTPNAYAMVAAGGPVYPSASVFTAELDEPTPITVTKDGRIFGHIALWGTCHTGFQNSCVTPPYSATNYAWFRTGALQTAEGTEVPVGHITMATGHAPAAMSAAPAAAHYDNTGAVVADVAAGEDRHGIWIAGALRSDLSETELRELRSAPLSGDWRSVGGQLELVHILAVNQPGFVVPRTKALVASGRTQSLFLPTGATTFSETEIPAEEIAEPTEFEKFAAKAEALRIAQWATLFEKE